MTRILLVDDDPVARAIHARFLEGAGHDFTLAASGAEALDCLAAAPEGFDAVVTDVLLPDTEGFSFITQLRALAPSLPVLALASGVGRITLDLNRFARHLGADAALRKPLAPAVFLCVLAGLLEPEAAAPRF
jgi:CheY-like chemotaxis protein